MGPDGALMFLVLYLNRGGAEVARKTHNLEDVGSRPTSGISSFVGFSETDGQSLLATLNKRATLHRDGAEGARGAHNPEVTGSIPVPGIYHSGRFTESANAVSTATLTALAHRKSAGLITLR